MSGREYWAQALVIVLGVAARAVQENILVADSLMASAGPRWKGVNGTGRGPEGKRGAFW